MDVADTVDEQAAWTEAKAARARGDRDAELAAYEAILAATPDDVDALTAKGAALRAAGRPRESLMMLLRALSLRPDCLAARVEMASSLLALGRRAEAAPVLSALARSPNAPAEVWHLLARASLAGGHADAARACLARTVALDPTRVDARRQLADMAARDGDLTGATDQYHDILAMAPGDAEARAGLGQALIGLGRLAEAEDQLERALVMDDENVVARLGRARLRLLEGDFPSAWEDYEWRWQLPGRARPEPPGESWDGGPLDGRAILLWAEAGYEETVQMARYVPKVAAMGGKVVLAVPAPMTALFESLEGVSHVVASGCPLPIRVSVNASLMDLPRLFGTTLATVPAPIPYIGPPTARRIPVVTPPATHLRVGLAWANGRPDWSMPFTEAVPLLGRPDIAVFGLQLGPMAEDARRLAHPALITDLGPTISDLGDLAARIAEMDVVATVDGIVAHVAGAMGKPVLLMLPASADWRWLLEREDSPWYPAMRLFRQDRAGDWTGVVTRVLMDLEARAGAEADLRAKALHAQSGSRAAMRALLAGHLQAGDGFIDIGAGDGTFTLDAAAHPSGDVLVLAIEAKRGDAEILADTVAISGAEEVVEVVAEPVAGCAMPAVVAKHPRRGRTVFPLPDWVAARAETVAVDSLLSDRPRLADRRLVVRIGTRSSEGEVLDGLWETLITQRAAAVAFEHREGAAAAETLAQAGYTLWRFPIELAGGPVQSFAGQPGPVIALASGIAPAPCYGDLSDPASPAALARARLDAATLAAEGTTAMMDGDIATAVRHLSRALAADPANQQANTNLAVLLRRAGRADAAVACCRRALACGAGAGVRANLASVLRDLGQVEAAELEFLRALSVEPANPPFLFGFAMLERLRGRAREALATLERIETLSPGAVPRFQLAQALLKSGNLARGMAEMAHRPRVGLPPVPGAAAWEGERLEARTILVRDEGDAIDAVMLGRYIPRVAAQGGLVTVECVPEAARLLATLPGVEAVVPRGQPLPAMDLVVDLRDVPRILGTTSRTTPPRDVPYLHLPDDMAPRAFPGDGRLKVGMAWAGRDTDPAVPVRHLLRLVSEPGLRLVSLQRGPRAADLAATGADAFIDDLGAGCADLADVAAVIAGLDLVVATDCAEAHIAGALGKPVWVLLPRGNDWRWVDHRDDSVWYPTMRVFRQAEDGSWDRAVARVLASVEAMAAGMRGH